MKKLFLSILLFLFVFSVAATHMRGGIITYRHVSGKKYDFFLTQYADCGAIPPYTFPLSIYGDTGVLLDTVGNFTKVSAREITVFDTVGSCSPQTSCNSSSGNLGFEEHVWKTTIDFSNYSGYCKFTVSFDQVSRIQAITTGSANSNFFIASYINLCYDSSGRSVSKSNAPNLVLRQGADTYMNPRFSDELNYFDSISYALVAPMISLSQNANYSGSFNAQRPLTFFGFPSVNLSWPAGFHFNQHNANFEFRATQSSQIAPIVYRMYGWKLVNDTMRLVSWFHEEVVYTVESNGSCGGLTAQVNVEHDTWKVCANRTLKISKFIAGSNSADTFQVRITIDDPILTIDTVLWQNDSVMLDLYLTPDTSHISTKPRYIFYEISKSACPCRVLYSFVEEYQVTPPLDSTLVPSWEYSRSCNTLQVKAIDSGNYQRPLYVSIDSGAYVQDSNSYILNDTGWVTVFIKQDQGGCAMVFLDSFYVDSLYTFQALTVVEDRPCFNAVTTIHSSASGGLGIQSYLWQDSSTLDSFHFTITQDTSFWVELMDSSGCVSRTTAQIKMDSLLFITTKSRLLCTELPNDSIQLDATVTGGTQPYQYTWQGIGSGNNLMWMPPMQDKEVILAVTDSVGCTFTDTLDFIRYTPSYPVSAPDVKGCELSAALLSVQNKQSHGDYTWLGVGSGDSLQTQVVIGHTPYIIQYEDSLACRTYDTLWVRNYTNPEFVLPMDSVVCRGTSISIYPSVQKAIYPRTYDWRPVSSSTDSLLTMTFYSSKSIYLTITDSAGCKSVDTMEVYTNGIPQIAAQNPMVFCSADSVLDLTSISGTLNGIWSGSHVTGSGPYFFDARNVAYGDYLAKFSLYSANGVCVATDSVLIRLRQSPTLDLGADTGLCEGSVLILRPNYSTFNGSLTFAWNGIAQQNGKTYSHTFSSDSLIRLVAKDMLGCEVSDSVFLSSYRLPIPQLSSPATLSVCTGDSIFVQIDTLGLGSSGIISTIPANLNNNYWRIYSNSQLYVSLTNSSGCQSDSVFQFVSKAGPQIIMSDTQFTCANQGLVDLIMWATPLAGSWYGRNQASVQNGKFNPSTADTGFNTLYYTYTNLDGCTAVDSMQVYVEPLATMTFTADSTKGKFPLTVKFTHQSSGAYLNHFTWFFGDGDSSNLENPTHVYMKPGTYSVSLIIDGIYCQNSLVRFNYIQVDSTGGVGIYQVKGQNVYLYPNPSTGFIQLSPIYENQAILIYDNAGKQVTFNMLNRNSESLQIDVSHLAEGVYLLYVETDGIKGLPMRFVKE